MPQCKVERRVGQEIYYCIEETPHVGEHRYYDWHSLPAKVKQAECDATRDALIAAALAEYERHKDYAHVVGPDEARWPNGNWKCVCGLCKAADAYRRARGKS